MTKGLGRQEGGYGEQAVIKGFGQHVVFYRGIGIVLGGQIVLYMQWICMAALAPNPASCQ